MSFFNFINDSTKTTKTFQQEIIPKIESSNSFKKIIKKCKHYSNNLLVYADCCNEYFEWKCTTSKSTDSF